MGHAIRVPENFDLRLQARELERSIGLGERSTDNVQASNTDHDRKDQDYRKDDD